jgi:hypothetical protein
MAAAGLEGAAQEDVMPGEGDGHGIAVIFPKTRAPLDIREEECNGTCGQRCHGLDAGL